MTDKELKKQLKKLGVVLLLIFGLMIVLSVYTLGSTKANLSIYKQANQVDHFKIWGFNEEELKSYLSIFGNLETTDVGKENLLDMAIHFIDTMCSYEPESNESGQIYYDADMVNQIIKEMNGEYLKPGTDLGSAYTYDAEKNVYIQNQISEQRPFCLQIEEITKEDDKFQIIYQLVDMTNIQIAEYEAEKEMDFEAHTMKVTILKNEDYEYSKYFVTHIEEMNHT